MSRRILFSEREMLLVHILCVTCIINDDGVFLYRVGIVLILHLSGRIWL